MAAIITSPMIHCLIGNREDNLRQGSRKTIKNILMFICIILIFIVPGMPAKAATDAEMLDNGNFEFTTTDTAATTDITWETIGFTVRRDKSGGNPLKDDKYATFKLKSGQKIESTNPDGTKTVTFYLTKWQVNEALEGTDLETIQKNDVLYLNGIIKVHNGTKDQDTYYTLDGIKNAEVWANPNDFNDRFDVRIVYQAGDPEFPVQITFQLYQGGNYNTVDTTYYKNQNENSESEVNFQTHDEIILTYHNIPKTREVNGETYYLYRVYYQNLPSTKKLGNRKLASDPNLDMEAYDRDVAYIRNRTFYVQGSKENAKLNIVGIYRRFPPIPPRDGAEEVIKEYEEIDPTAVIAADARGNEEYEVLDGIPGTESLYANAFTGKYLAGSTFTRKYGTKVYNVKVKITYNLSWTTTTTDPTTGETVTKHEHESVPMTYNYPIQRNFSYWIISALGVYGIENAVLNNDALPGESVTLTPVGYDPPSVDYIHSEEEDEHLIQPENNITVNLGSESVNSSNVPRREYWDEAEDAVAKIRCMNDKLVFNGVTIMSDEEKEEETDAPGDIPSGLEEIGENVLYKSNLVIHGTMANGEYESTGTVNYKPITELNPSEVETSYELEDVNSVVVHTPAVCDAKVQTNNKDNQMITPDKTKASLVLDRPFYVTLPTTGNHREIKGYEYQDYGDYIDSRQVKFAFDVYKGSSANDSFIKKDTWTSVSSNTQFYLPTWVNEGKYTINFRSIAINAEANDGISKTEPLANGELENYVATDTVNVEVSGRIYGLNLYDISDYPMWQDVFRIPNSLSLTGFKYTVGDKDQNGNSNGNDPKYTLPLVNGVHPKYGNVGAVKTGYVTRFKLKTVGNMYGDNDYIRILPTFYYVDNTGKNRQEVDIYYSETFNGKRNIMVKMGSSVDLENKKSLRTGDLYLGIPEQALSQTAYYQGMTLKDWKAQVKNIFTYTNIMLPGSLRTFVGYIANVPGNVSQAGVAKSVQNWYGEYYLPSEIHAVPKGYDINNYIRYNGGLNYKESFWLKDGYIIINFNIETVQNGQRHLSYINADNAAKGYCNMWSREGYQYRKVDNKGNEFNFLDGDYVLYYTDKSASKDYISAGTH